MTEERGATMVEMMGVISIIGIVGMGVWTLINSARARYRLSQGVLQLQSLEKGISRFYASAGKYDGLAEDGAIKELIDNHILPPGMNAGDNTLRHAFGGSVEIKNVKYSNIDEYGSSSDSFSITFKDLGRNECFEMLTVVWPQSDAANLVSIAAGGKTFVWPSYSSTNNSASVLPVSAADAMSICQDAPKDISWEFR